MAGVTKVHGLTALASMVINGREFQVYTLTRIGGGNFTADEQTLAIRTLQQFYTVEAIGSLAIDTAFNLIMSGGDDSRDLTDLVDKALGGDGSGTVATVAAMAF